MTATMTDKQREAVAAMEAARSQGCSLTEYARANGLDVRRIFAILRMLRRRGLLPKSERKRRSPFVAVVSAGGIFQLPTSALAVE